MMLRTVTTLKQEKEMKVWQTVDASTSVQVLCQAALAGGVGRAQPSRPPSHEHETWTNQVLELYCDLVAEATAQPCRILHAEAICLAANSATNELESHYSKDSSDTEN
jgi:hypothetical protein